MFRIKKTFTVSAAHCLSHLNYKSACKRVHGHNWKITVFCKAAKLDKNGMVVDFAKVKKMIHSKMDHRMLNEIGIGLTTAEGIAFWVVETINAKYRDGLLARMCYRADVEESEGSTASYEI